VENRVLSFLLDSPILYAFRINRGGIREKSRIHRVQSNVTGRQLVATNTANRQTQTQTIQLQQLVPAVTTNTQIHETPEFKTQQIAQPPRRCSVQGAFHYY
jgi:hypothetical protein